MRLAFCQLKIYNKIMEQFQKYMDKNINLDNVKNSEQLEKFGISCEYLPDPPEDFDEFEFVTDFKGKNVSIGITIELGKIKKIMFGLIDPEKPDVIKAFNESEMEEFLRQKGDKLIQFFDYITQ